VTAQLPTDAEAFARFLNAQIETGVTDKSPEELLRIWREDHAEAIEEVRQGIQNMDAGLGRSFDEVDREIRDEFGFAK
jgi:hypothetical protein